MLKLILAFIILVFSVSSLEAENKVLALAPDFAIYYINFDGDYMVYFEGDMVPSSMLYLIDAMETAQVDKLAINSNGGSLMEGFILGSYIEQQDISVYIPVNSICVSACAFAIMKSDDIKNDGKGILFHTPFLVQFDPSLSINDILKENAQVTIDMVEWFMDAGYSIDLLNIIYDYTDKEKFVVFQDPEFLYEFKVNEFSQSVEIKPEWFKIEER